MERSELAVFTARQSASLRIARRRRNPRPFMVALLGLLVAGAVATRGGGTEPAEAEVFDPALFAEAGVASADAGDERELPQVFARFEGLELLLPSRDVLLVGFHEAARPESVALEPVGHARANENTTKIDTPPESAGPDYVILSSRGRRQAASSAVDLSMMDDVPVTSPVTGRVIEVTSYFLYGKHPDTRIEIVPDVRPDLRVVLIHVDEVVVQPGDVVVAGETVIADTANRFPFGSHIDRYFDPVRWPHVHIEVKPAA